MVGMLIKINFTFKKFNVWSNIIDKIRIFSVLEKGKGQGKGGGGIFIQQTNWTSFLVIFF